MSDEAVMALIMRHIQRYSALDILDVYRLLHQAVFGAGHPVHNIRAAREHLENECNKLTPNHSEALLESVHPTNEVVRVNLRPYLAVRGNLKKLMEAFIKSSTLARGNVETFAAWWAIFQQMTEAGGALSNRFSARTVSLIGRTRAAENYPASPHSPPYDQAHKPAYRVMLYPIALELLSEQTINIAGVA